MTSPGSGSVSGGLDARGDPHDRNYRRSGVFNPIRIFASETTRPGGGLGRDARDLSSEDGPVRQSTPAVFGLTSLDGPDPEPTPHAGVPEGTGPMKEDGSLPGG